MGRSQRGRTGGGDRLSAGEVQGGALPDGAGFAAGPARPRQADPPATAPAPVRAPAPRPRAEPSLLLARKRGSRPMFGNRSFKSTSSASSPPSSRRSPRVPEGALAHPTAPQFSSSQACIRLRRSPRPPAGTATRIRTGNRRSASRLAICAALMADLGDRPATQPAAAAGFRAHADRAR
jgi:hypothetical protein